MTSLKDAIKNLSLKSFIKEHEKDEDGDTDKLNAILASMAGKSTEDQATSDQGKDGD